MWREKEKKEDLPLSVTAQDELLFQELVRSSPTKEQIDAIMYPTEEYTQEEAVCAIHWHPEQVPFSLVRQRIDHLFPNRRVELIIPTQHNELLSWDSLSGAELDCYSPEIGKPIQLLIHLQSNRLKKSGCLPAMLQEIRRRRVTRFMEILSLLAEGRDSFCIDRAAIRSGASPDVVLFATLMAVKLRTLIAQMSCDIPEFLLRNRLLLKFIRLQRGSHDDLFITRALLFVKEIKRALKREERYDRWIAARDIIEEVRFLGGGIVIPHPEDFWPILEVDYDIDGYEIWNPRSHKFTERLLTILIEKNRTRSRTKRRLLPFMGDDCHFGVFLSLTPSFQPKERYGEIGRQPAWYQEDVRRLLKKGGFSKEEIMTEYRARITA